LTVAGDPLAVVFAPGRRVGEPVESEGYGFPMASTPDEAGQYDVVVVGARCSGSPTAMLLARRGYRVLLVEKYSLSRDVVTGHYVHPPGVGHLTSWGLLEAAVAGCPPITTVTADLGSVRFTVDYESGCVRVGERTFPLPEDKRYEWPAYAPRRPVLDTVLRDAAVGAGATFAQHTEAVSLLFEGARVVGVHLEAREADGLSGDVNARWVVGGDGIHSLVAKQVGAEEYDVTPAQTCSYRSYWRGLECSGLEYFVREGQSVLMMPTHDEQTWLSVGSPIERFAELRHDVEGCYLRAIALVPELSERLAGAARAERIVGMAVPRSYYRRPYGPGWALVGDAGYHKDPSAGQGITDAFRDSELLAHALDLVLSGQESEDVALSAYESDRNAASARGHDLTQRLARRSDAGDPFELFARFGPPN
jgi:2-polyprenyl-6-methoxyphenol hydroxylase-like FAD-dependent oxidoreductase